MFKSFLTFIILAVGIGTLFTVQHQDIEPYVVGMDGYTFTQTEYENLNFNVQLVLYRSQADINRVYTEMTNKVPPKGKVLRAFTMVEGDRCVLHIVDPNVSYEPDVVGHELFHCAYSDFHIPETIKLNEKE